MNLTQRNKWIYAWIPAVYAFVLYAVTLCRGAHPGFFSSLLAEHAGLTFKPPVLHPVWTILLRVFKELPLGSLAFWANACNALLGAVSVRLLTLIVMDIPHDRAAEETRFSRRDSGAGLISGFAAGMIMVTCIPLWVLSTRSHPLLLGIVWMLFLVRAVQRQWLSGETRGQWLIALCTGLGAAEYAGLLVASPLFLVSALLLALRTKSIVFRKTGGRPQRNALWLWIARWAGMYALGLLPYAVTAFIIHRSEAYRWFAKPTFLSIVRFAVSSQVSSVVGGIPRLGWIVIALSTFGVLAIILYRKKAETREQVAGSLFMHAVMTAVLLLIFLDWKISPWKLTGLRPFLLSPYVAAAGALGYLAGYWSRVLAGKSGAGSRRHPFTEYALAGITMLLAVFLTVKNYVVCHAGNLSIVHEYTASAVSELEDGQWLLSDRLLDAMLIIEAHEQKRSVHIIRPQYETQKPYLMYLRDQFDNDRLRAMAEISVSTLLDEWISKYDGSRHVVTLGNPEFWMRYGYGMHFKGPLMMAEASGADTIEEQKAYLDSFFRYAGERLPGQGLSTAWRDYIRQRLSKLANNCGFAQQMNDHHDAADALYIQAVNFNTNNISAWLNRLNLCRRTQCGRDEELRAEVRRARERRAGVGGIWHVSRMDGYVYSSEAFLQRGVSKAASADPEGGLREFERALTVDRDDPRVRLLMSALRLKLGDYEAGRKTYMDILKSDPENRNALLMLARIGMMQGEYDAARGFLDRLNQLGFNPVSLHLEYSILNLLSGDHARAYERLEAIIKQGRSDLRVYIIMALIGLDTDDRDMVQRSVDEIKKTDLADIPQLFLLLGRTALFMGESGEARRLFKAAAKSARYREQALQALLAMAASENMSSDLKEQAEELLRINPDNYYANYIIGVIHIQREQYALALSYLYVAAAQKPTADIVNTLAYALVNSEKYEEGLQVARNAVELDSSNGHAWDTLAMAQMNLDQWERAHESLNRALLLMPDHPEIIYHMAQVKEHQGMNEQALDLIESLSDKLSLLSPSIVEDIRQMRIRLTR